MTVADRITEIHPATNLLSYQSTFLQEGARNFTLKKNNHKQRKSEKQKSAYKKKKQHWFHL